MLLFSFRTPSPNSDEDEAQDKVWNLCSIKHNAIKCVQLFRVCILEFFLNNVLLGENERLNAALHCHVDSFKRMFNNSQAKALVGEKKRQHALGFFKKKDGSEPRVLGPFPTDYLNGKHSEDYIIEEIKNMMPNKEINDYSEIWIYTVNSPCIGRKGKCPCMYNLIDLSVKLSQEYGIKMYIGFTKFYACIKNMADLITYSKKLEDSWNTIVEYCTLDLQLMFSVKFENLTNLNISMKTIPKNKKQDVCEGIRSILSKCPDSEQTYEAWKQTRNAMEEAFVLTLREKFGASDDEGFFAAVRSVFKKVWDGKLNEKFTETVSKQVVLFYLNRFQGSEHYPVFFKCNPYD